MAKRGIQIDGKKVRDLRRARLLQQLELADEIGIHPNIVSLIERDPDYNASFPTVRKLAEFFGCPATDLVIEDSQETVAS